MKTKKISLFYFLNKQNNFFKFLLRRGERKNEQNLVEIERNILRLLHGRETRTQLREHFLRFGHSQLNQIGGDRLVQW
jgi:DTW domain-containing protein YfiP